jgi:hypothetical protein
MLAKEGKNMVLKFHSPEAEDVIREVLNNEPESQ